MAAILIEDSKTLKEVILSVEDTGYFNQASINNIDEIFNEIGLISRFPNKLDYEGILDNNIISISLKNYDNSNFKYANNEKVRMINSKFFFKFTPEYDQDKGISDIYLNIRTHRSEDLPYRSEFDNNGQIYIHQWAFNGLSFRHDIKDPIYLEYNYNNPENKKNICNEHYLKKDTGFSIIYVEKTYKELIGFTILINNKSIKFDHNGFLRIIDLFPRLENIININNIKNLEDELTEDEKKILEIYFYK